MAPFKLTVQNTILGLLSTLFVVSVLAISAEPFTRDNIITSDQLGGKERYLLYVNTDKPIYRANESVYIRTFMLNAADNTPASAEQTQVNVEIKGPKGDVVFTGQTRVQHSTAGIEWKVPTGTAGGQYTAVVTSPSHGLPPAERSFDIRAYRAPRLKTQIEFTREGYGPGDTVQAALQVTRAEGGIPIGAAVTVVARVDGEEIFNQGGFKVDANGLVNAEFPLPATIATGDGAVSFVVEDGGVVEPASKTLPILLQNLNIEFYPEGGDLVAGLQNRVYVQALRPDGKPADISGFLVAERNGNSQNLTRVTLKTAHEGRGILAFKPEANTQYSLALTTPSGIKRRFPLPTVARQGATLQSPKATYAYGDAIALNVQATFNGEFTLSLHKRERLLHTQPFKLNKLASAHTVKLDPKDAEGVLIATLWDSQGKPLAERLIYRAPKFAVNIDIKAAKDRYVPGEKVQLDITTTDENGRPVEAVVGLTVTDDTVLEMIDKREQAPRLPVMVYLENEVLDLADAHVYLDNTNPDAPRAVDLLLATQGWRRFILVDYPAIQAVHGDAAKRALAHSVQQELRPMLARMRGGAVDEMIFADAIPEMAMDLRAQELEQEMPAEIMAMDEPAPRQNVAKKEKAFADRENLNEAFAKRAMLAPPAYIVREYAHATRPNRKANDRQDFTETLYWNAGIQTSARDGKASVSFDLSDSVTGFRVLADAFGRNGALGSGDTVIESVEPFYIEPKLPLAITVGDVIELPVAMVNGTRETLKQATLLVRAEGLTIRQTKPLDLSAEQRGRVIVRIEATKPGNYELSFNATAGNYADSVKRTLTVHPRGFPVSITEGGLLASDRRFQTDLIIPQQVEAGSITAVAKVYPSPLASMEEALNTLLREPYGCFEQTSSTTYPLVMAQQYFLSHQGIEPDKIANAKDLLKKGYDRLIGFETAEKGYEWFGGTPAHEALTAYGLMEFVDLAKVMPVDEAMITRTRKWLLERRDGQGGFKRDQKAIDSFGRAPAPTTNAYIVWSLLESGQAPSTLSAEIAAVKKEALTTKDTYVIALASNILYLANDAASGRNLAMKLREAMAKDGSISNAVTSITQSGGDALTIETTSLTLLAWLKEDDHWAAQVEQAITWLFERSKSGRFGSTQSTVLALKAINTYDAARAKPKKPGSVQLVIDGKPFGKPVSFDEQTKGAIELPDFAVKLTAGNHSLALQMQDGSKMPFALEVKYHTLVPPGKAKQISLSTALSQSQVTEGETVELTAKITVGPQNAPTPIAIIGIPAGLEVRHDQLKELVGADRISAYEVIGQEVVLYWRGLKAEEQVSIPLSLTAAVPGEYNGAASRTYLYYTDEDKSWTQGVRVVISKR